MIKQNPAARKHTITFPIIFRNPIRIQLCHSIRASRIKRRLLCLRHLLHFTEHFRSSRLIKMCLWFHHTNCFQHICHSKRVNLSCRQRLFPACPYKRLRRQIIYLICHRNLHRMHKRYEICHICIDKMNLLSDMPDIPIIDNALAAHDAIYLISFFQQKLCQIGAILSRNSGNKCSLHYFRSTPLNAVITN